MTEDLEGLVAEAMYEINQQWAMSEYNARPLPWDGKAFLVEARDFLKRREGREVGEGEAPQS